MIYGGVFERHRSCRFIVAHTGSAFIGLLERLDHGFQLFHECREHITGLPSVFARQNLYYDTCAFSKGFIEMAVGEIGIDHFMFGTDYPYIIADPSYIAALDLPDGRQGQDLRRQCAAAVCQAAGYSLMGAEHFYRWRVGGHAPIRSAIKRRCTACGAIGGRFGHDGLRIADVLADAADRIAQRTVRYGRATHPCHFASDTANAPTGR